MKVLTEVELHKIKSDVREIMSRGVLQTPEEQVDALNTMQRMMGILESTINFNHSLEDEIRRQRGVIKNQSELYQKMKREMADLREKLKMKADADRIRRSITSQQIDEEPMLIGEYGKLPDGCRWLERPDSEFEIGGRATDVSQIYHSLYDRVRARFPINGVPVDICDRLGSLKRALCAGEIGIKNIIFRVGVLMTDPRRDL